MLSSLPRWSPVPLLWGQRPSSLLIEEAPSHIKDRLSTSNLLGSLILVVETMANCTQHETLMWRPLSTNLSLSTIGSCLASHRQKLRAIGSWSQLRSTTLLENLLSIKMKRERNLMKNVIVVMLKFTWTLTASLSSWLYTLLWGISRWTLYHPKNVTFTLRARFKQLLSPPRKLDEHAKNANNSLLLGQWLGLLEMTPLLFPSQLSKGRI